eukprot:TRINITY_DN16851_c0_g1_i1.p1 TRINITY_DN16851_c0_g1~~TRINITY_DN16851_c0_g1_i1.p1  ORF type:complete len:228 (+),score=44.77 TRINITY_DN16851_c0_g1_i1:64-747(+)
MEVPVEYITTTGCEKTVVHFFQTVLDQTVQGRVFILVDHPTVKVDFETAMHRCVEVSKISTMAVQAPELIQHIRQAATNKYEQLLSKLAMVDFVRMVGGIYRPGDSDLPILEMAEGQMIGPRVVVRPGALVKVRKSSQPPQAMSLSPSARPGVSPGGGDLGDWVDPTGSHTAMPIGGMGRGRSAYRTPPQVALPPGRHVPMQQTAGGTPANAIRLPSGGVGGNYVGV